ncbi:hypothetical protein HMPREF1587_01505 [Bifidobacterium breve JCP7499]|nr:hypothetical protein HMPREF1587_01505 [Bifidobacterium breve JCP7499]
MERFKSAPRNGIRPSERFASASRNGDRYFQTSKSAFQRSCRMSSAFKGVPRLRDREYLRWNINAHTCDIRVSIPL